MQELALVIVYYLGMTNYIVSEERVPYETLEECLRDASEMNKQPTRDREGVPHRFQAGCAFFVDEKLWS